MNQENHFKIYQDEKVGKALDQIKQICIDNNWTLAVAESVSSGVLQALLASEPEAGLFFEGGVTIYNCKQKARQLRIPEEKCEPCSGISPEIAELLAKNIIQKFNCNIGLSLTGYSCPIPEKGISQLFAYGAIFFENNLIGCKIFMAKDGTPEEIKRFYSESIILECAKLLKNQQFLAEFSSKNQLN